MKTNAGLIYTELFEHNLGIAIGLSQRCEVSIQLTYMFGGTRIKRYVFFANFGFRALLSLLKRGLQRP